VTTWADLGLDPAHIALLQASAISTEVAAERGYCTVHATQRLADLGFSALQRRVPGLLIPIRGVTGEVVGYEYRPDEPRSDHRGRLTKYEHPAGSANRLDVPPRACAQLRVPSKALWITEGARKADAAVSAGLCCIGVPGVYGWRGTDPDTGGLTALGDWEAIACIGRRGNDGGKIARTVVLAFDSDVSSNPAVHEARRRLAEFLRSRGARVRVCELPTDGDGKMGLDDFLSTHSVAELEALVVDYHPTRPRGRVHFVRADEVEVEDVEFFAEPMIPLRVATVVVGVDGVGKSTLLYDRSALATRGLLPGKFLGEPVDVVIASSEDHAGSVIIPRLMAANADLARCHIVKVNRSGVDGDLAIPDDLDQVTAEIERVHARLFIVDPLVAHLPMSIDSYKAQHARAAMGPLTHIAEHYGLAVACVIHFNGALSTDVRTRTSASKAFSDTARSIVVCGVDPTDASRFVVVQNKHSFGPKTNTGTAYEIVEATVTDRHGKTHTTSRIEWCGEIDVDVRDVVAGPQSERPAPKRDAAEALLVELLADRAMLRNDIETAAKARGISWRTIERTKWDLGIDDAQIPEPGKQGAGLSWWFFPAHRPAAKGPQPGPDGKVRHQGDGGPLATPQPAPGAGSEAAANGPPPAPVADHSSNGNHAGPLHVRLFDGSALAIDESEVF
jgi:hypothetical protein